MSKKNRMIRSAFAADESGESGQLADVTPIRPETPLETYQVPAAELWRSRFLDERAARLIAQISNAQQEVAQLQRERTELLNQLGERFVEGGQYELIGDVDGQTGVGKRRRVS
jgi:hypothetical protein